MEASHLTQFIPMDEFVQVNRLNGNPTSYLFPIAIKSESPGCE